MAAHYISFLLEVGPKIEAVLEMEDDIKWSKIAEKLSFSGTTADDLKTYMEDKI